MALFLSRLDKKNYPGVEKARVTQSLGRVTAFPVYARISSPNFHMAAMDGFAVSAKTTFGAGPDRVQRLRIGSEAWPVNTGFPIPQGTNAVIMIEDVSFVDDISFEIEKALAPWQNVRRVGEDFVASEMILPARHIITAYDQGALIAGGVTVVDVVEKPRVVLIPTGSELAQPESTDGSEQVSGKIFEFNTIVLSGLIEAAGGTAARTEIVPDDFEIIKDAIRNAVNSDAHIVVVNAGSSAGSEDFTAAAVRELGEVLVHGVAMMPGKPTILGLIQGKPVIGNPGYPVSAILSFEVFGIPIIEAMQGVPARQRPTMKAVAVRKIPSKLGREEFLRVKLGRVGDRVIAAPLPRGAGSITTLTRADGIIRIPSRSEGINQGSEVTVELLRAPAEIERTLVAIGSHDLILDLLADELIPRSVYLSSSHVGSMGGLLALKNGNAHLATSHLLDLETGIYNWSYIKRFIPEIPVKLFHCVMREQGFMVPRGNPKGILGFKDLTRDDVKFINRQSGAGTRVLLDYHLAELGIDPGNIDGYEMEEYTHTSVAVAVLSGVADVGMGVLSAANALGLDFVPVATEQYDIVIPEEFVNDVKVQTLLEILRKHNTSERESALLEATEWTGLGGGFAA